MKPKGLFILLLIGLIVLMAACGSRDAKEQSKMDSATSSDENFVESEMDFSAGSEELAMDDEQGNSTETDDITNNRMIIHRAELRVDVKNFGQAQLSIEKKVDEYRGYIIESNVYRESDDIISGSISVRVPEKYFQNFLLDIEGEVAEVVERNVTGQDVTEQYVDLESRVNSKRAVEKRLLEFMAEAEKTEDLLKISSELAEVQEDIEVLVGKMNYLENQKSYSTIEITMFENRVIIPGLDNKNLNTWEKVKKQLASSTNFIFAAGSGLIVFFIGNLPIITLLLLVGGAIYFVIKKNTKKT